MLDSLDKITNAIYQALVAISKNYNSIKANQLRLSHCGIKDESFKDKHCNSPRAV